MGNIRDRLKDLFFKSLEHPNLDTTIRVYDYRGSSSIHLNDEDFDFGLIYFYEWSDIHSLPKHFYTFKTFNKFLSDSGISINDSQWNEIKRIRNAYIACKKNTKDLLIKESYNSLRDALAEPTVISCKVFPSNIQRPPMYREVENRYPEEAPFPNMWLG